MNQFKTDIESTIQLYLRKELADELVEPFEDYFVDKPELIDKIETARSMMRALNELDESELSLLEPVDERSIEPSMTSQYQPRQGVKSPRFWQWAVSLVSTPIPAYVSAGVCMALVAWLGLPQKPISDAPTLIGFSTQLTRSTGNAVTVDLSNPHPSRAVFLRVPTVDYRRYVLSVIDPSSNALLWQSDPFSFSALNDQMVLLPQSLTVPNAKLELLAERPGQSSERVKFCHYSEQCD